MKLGELRKLTRAMSAMDGIQAHKEMERRMREAGLDPGSFYQELEMTSALVDTHRDISCTATAFMSCCGAPSAMGWNIWWGRSGTGCARGI